MHSYAELILVIDGKEYYSRRDLSQIDIDKLIAPKPDYPAGFSEGVQAMERRDQRRLNILHHAHGLARHMADQMNDLDGWNGEERREKTEKAVG